MNTPTTSESDPGAPLPTPTAAFRNCLPWYTTATLAVALSPQAKAIVVEYSSGLTTPQNGALFFDLATGASQLGSPIGGVSEFSLQVENFSSSGSTIGGAFLGGVSSYAYVLNDRRTGYYVRKLHPSESIGPGGARGQFSYYGLLSQDTAYNGSTYHYGEWHLGDTGYAGLQFELADGTTHYGWAEITLNPGYSVTLDAFAYETDPDLAITVPEAGSTHSLLLMAMGAMGLAAYRTRRAALPASPQ